MHDGPLDSDPAQEPVGLVWDRKAVGAAALTAVTTFPIAALIMFYLGTGIATSYDFGAGFGFLLIMVVFTLVPLSAVAAILAGALACVTRTGQPPSVRTARHRALIMVGVGVALAPILLFLFASV